MNSSKTFSINSREKFSRNIPNFLLRIPPMIITENSPKNYPQFLLRLFRKTLLGFERKLSSGIGLDIIKRIAPEIYQIS